MIGQLIGLIIGLALVELMDRPEPPPEYKKPVHPGWAMLEDEDDDQR